MSHSPRPAVYRGAAAACEQQLSQREYLSCLVVDVKSLSCLCPFLSVPVEGRLYVKLHQCDVGVAKRQTR